jgi:hypothetical protein
MNAQSSRSHTLFVLEVDSAPVETPEEVVSSKVRANINTSRPGLEYHISSSPSMSTERHWDSCAHCVDDVC